MGVSVECFMIDLYRLSLIRYALSYGIITKYNVSAPVVVAIHFGSISLKNAKLLTELVLYIRHSVRVSVCQL